jgi:hypothetical protein
MTEPIYQDGLEVTACNFCQYKEPVEGLKDYGTSSASFRKGRKNIFCKICANTPAGNAHQYPDQYYGQVAILQTICWIGNRLRDDLKGKQKHE